MNIEEFREICIKKPFVTEEFPFDETTLVFKVKGKIFALTSLTKEFSLNLKCDPARALKLRDQFTAVNPGYHMNKKHWNTISIDQTIPFTSILEWIEQSYLLVIKSLPKKEQKDILELISL